MVASTVESEVCQTAPLRSDKGAITIPQLQHGNVEICWPQESFGGGAMDTSLGHICFKSSQHDWNELVEKNSLQEWFLHAANEVCIPNYFLLILLMIANFNLIGEFVPYMLGQLYGPRKQFFGPLEKL